MANKTLADSSNDPSLSFVQPQYSGFQSSKDQYATNSFLSNNFVKAGLIGFGLDALRRVHREQLANNPKYLPALTKIVNAFEEYSPNKIGRTLGIGERVAAYHAHTNPLSYTREQLVKPSGQLTSIGSGFQRLFGDRMDIASEATEGLTFAGGNKASQYVPLVGRPDIEVQFGPARGQRVASAYRLNKPLQPKPIKWSTNSSIVGKSIENFREIKKSQMPGIHPGGIDKTVEFLPVHAWFDAEKSTSRLSSLGNLAKNVPSKIEREIFGPVGLERMQKLGAEVGLGLTQGTYNKAFTIPFLAKQGERGLINEMLLKRVLPIAVGLTALKYADYLTGHKVSNTLVDIPLKANVLRAELTDRLPGARSVTDFYSQTVPGSQYAPLALPLGGAFVGGLIHYGKVLSKNGYASDKLRHEASKLLPDLKELKNVKNLEGLKTGLSKTWKSLGAPGKGLAIGLAAMIPFIPGMLGSRKNASELKDIYSGEENVPIRSGRFWSLGSSPFSGGRITAWRPHWSVLFKSRAREKSLWGSEKEAWANNAFLHPIRALRNPYALEERHYDDRPYPVTSPAFSNVPLVGPLLAATIGKLIKPPKRMHEDEFDERAYNMYSTRLNPKGPLVESKFEKDVLQDLARAGYKAKTQVKEGNYRLDFVIEGDNGKKLAIETDGASYHTKWNAKDDAERQKNLEDAGWDILHVNSTPYFNDPASSMKDVFAALNKRGIKPTGNDDQDVRSGLIGLAPAKPKDEFGLFNVIKEEAEIFADFVGLTGYIAKTVLEKTFPNHNKDREAYLQGSRQMDSTSRAYYETNIGEGLGPNLGAEGGTFGYTEPLRRFIQRDRSGVQVNDIPNTMPSWLPGEDYLTNFKVGDPFIKLDQGFARLPGAGYEAIHTELEGLNPEDYPDMNKLEILSDVAPYSREFNIFKDKLGKSITDPETRIKYEKILNQAQQTKDSILQVDKRRFTGETDKISGTVKSATSRGVELVENPGQIFKYSSLGMSGADLSAVVLGQNNRMTRSEVANEVVSRQQKAQDYIGDILRPGTSINLTVAKGAADNAEQVSAVFDVDGLNLNKDLIDKGYAQYNKKYGGAESGEIFGTLGNIIGSLGEMASFDLAQVMPAPYHTKLWQERTAYDQYVSQEVVGTRMRRWDRPFDDFASPYARGALNKATGAKVMAESTIIRRDLNTLTDQLKYLRGLHNIAEGNGDEYTRDTRRTNIGANLVASPIFVASTIPDRDKRYFQSFLSETDPNKRLDILKIVPPEMAKTLQAQWAAADARMAKARGEDPGLVAEQGRLVTKQNLEEYSKAETQLGYGDYLRSKEIGDFFSRTGFSLPDSGESEIFSNNIDYEDVKLKIIQNEGYDAHDFNIFDDRAAMLWRKPYIDGAVSSLTSGDSSKSGEQIRRSVEQLMINANNKNPKANVVTQTSRIDKNNVKINIEVDEQEKLLKDIRRNPEEYQSE